MNPDGETRWCPCSSALYQISFLKCRPFVWKRRENFNFYSPAPLIEAWDNDVKLI